MANSEAVQRFDSGALGSDIPRSRAQYWVRRISQGLVRLLGLNEPGFVGTEFIQAIQPIASIATPQGELVSRGGHGRLLWRAKTFYTEEPDTVKWLDSISKDDVLWDIGANVGLYSIYAAKFRGSRVYSFEPESQNFALLIENILLNGVSERCFPACIAIAEKFGLGRLHVRSLTKGGAYNLYESPSPGEKEIPESIRIVGGGYGNGTLQQMAFGVSVDELIDRFSVEPPTHLKVDVDGIEPMIIDGASRLLQNPRLRTVLIEVNKKSSRDLAISEILAKKGFKITSERSNWLSRTDRSKEELMPQANMTFWRG